MGAGSDTVLESAAEGLCVDRFSVVWCRRESGETRSDTAGMRKSDGGFAGRMSDGWLQRKVVVGGDFLMVAGRTSGHLGRCDFSVVW